MSNVSEDSEVACYVLAYLLHENYSATATSFLKECRVLPTQSLLVLPQASLKSIITEHKARHDSLVMLNTLGSGTTFQALWTKLNKTLQQMKGLYDQVLSNQPAATTQHRTGIVRGHHRPPPSKGRSKQLTVSTTTAAVQSKPIITRSGTPTLSSNPPTHSPAPQQPTAGHAPSHIPEQPSVSPPKSHAPSIPSSPHRRKQVPKRKAYPSSEVEPVGVAGPSYAPPSSPTMHQILETFLEDDYLPGKLADIINKCVESDNSTPELSSTALDSILNMTQLEPAFEGLLQQTTPHTPGTNIGLQTAALPVTNTVPTTGLPTAPTTSHLVSQLSSSISQQTMTDHISEQATSVAAGSSEAVANQEAIASTSKQLNSTTATVVDLTGTSLLGGGQAGLSGHSEGQRSLVRLSQPGGSPPSAKRMKLTTDFSDGEGLFPTDQDIDDFLDKLHRDSNSNDIDSD